MKALYRIFKWKPFKWLEGGVAQVLFGLISFYQVFHQIFYTGCCRFHPTCSEYAREAVKLHGIWKGTGLTIKRILKCHPFTKGGFDFVPTHNARTKSG